MCPVLRQKIITLETPSAFQCMMILLGLFLVVRWTVTLLPHPLASPDGLKGPPVAEDGAPFRLGAQHFTYLVDLISIISVDSVSKCHYGC